MSIFKFKQFKIEQGKAAMKVGTDGCLLGAWAIAANAKRILDIGTGTGLIALMLAQRYPLAAIDAIEIESEAYQQACNNFRQSLWANRLKVYHSAVQNFEAKHQYDCILSNPPFYPEAHFSIATEQQRRQARSSSTLSYTDLLAAIQRHLAPQGSFQLILPANLHQAFKKMAEDKGLYLKRICWVHPLPQKAANRVLASYCWEKQDTLSEKLVIRLDNTSSHQYSPEYIRLLQEFLIIF